MKLDRSNFDTFCVQLERRLKQPLPGETAHLKMSSRLRLQQLQNMDNYNHAVKSAVLVLIYPNSNSISIPFILRPHYDGVHAGQVAFPGGRCEHDDPSVIYTALREAREEVNINPSAVTVLGTLTNLYIPPSNYLVTPVVGFAKSKPEFIKDPGEVADIIEADIDFLFDESLRKEKTIDVRGHSIQAPYFDVKNHVVWGATAMILSELSEVIESIG